VQICGSTIGTVPNAIDNIANAIRMIEAHTPKAMSEEFSRSCFATGGYKIVGKIVGENRVTSIFKSIPSIEAMSLESAPRFERRQSSWSQA
jgi:hypothetical protein